MTWTLIKKESSVFASSAQRTREREIKGEKLVNESKLEVEESTNTDLFEHCILSGVSQASMGALFDKRSALHSYRLTFPSSCSAILLATEQF